MGLAMATAGSAFIAFTTKADFFVYIFVFSAMGLAGYCYKLSQMRRYQSGSNTQGYRRDWIRAS
jgi:predicted membrane-bound mannosyltransferase